MKHLFETAQEIQDFFEENEWKFCFIGGIALQRWAKPRLTNDVDLTLLTGFGSEESFVDKILERYESRIDNAREFALTRRILLLRLNDIGIDISLGALFFEESAVKRASNFQFLPTAKLRICSAEDLIVYKAFADRDQDWVDVKNIISAQSDLNWDYIFDQLSPLVELKEAPEILRKLQQLKPK